MMIMPLWHIILLTGRGFDALLKVEITFIWMDGT